MVGGSARDQCSRSWAARAALRSASSAASTPSAASTAIKVLSGTSTRRPLQSSYAVEIPNRPASSTNDGAIWLIGNILLVEVSGRRPECPPQRHFSDGSRLLVAVLCAVNKPGDLPTTNRQVTALWHKPHAART